MSSAEAVADIIASESKAQHQMAMKQLRGRYRAMTMSVRGSRRTARGSSTGRNTRQRDRKSVV